MPSGGIRLSLLAGWVGKVGVRAAQWCWDMPVAPRQGWWARGCGAGSLLVGWVRGLVAGCRGDQLRDCRAGHGSMLVEQVYESRVESVEDSAREDRRSEGGFRRTCRRFRDGCCATSSTTAKRRATCSTTAKAASSTTVMPPRGLLQHREAATRPATPNPAAALRLCAFPPLNTQQPKSSHINQHSRTPRAPGRGPRQAPRPRAPPAQPAPSSAAPRAPT